MMTVASLM